MKKIIYDMYRLIKFYLRLSKLGVFKTYSPVNLLIVLREFMLSESKVYDSTTRILYKTPEQNANLLASLINVYLVTKSKATLEQILEVIKMTITRGK